VDGQENPLSIIQFGKLYEVQKYCAFTNHMWDGFWFVSNQKQWDRLPRDLQEVVDRNIEIAVQEQRSEIRRLNAEGMLAWRIRFRERLDLIAKRYPPRHEVDLDALADMIATLVEGGLILGRALNDITILPRQVLLYRDFVRSVFAPAG